MVKIIKVNKVGNKIESYTCTDGRKVIQLSKNEVIKLIRKKQVVNARLQVYRGKEIIRVREAFKEHTKSAEDKTIEHKETVVPERTDLYVALMAKGSDIYLYNIINGRGIRINGESNDIIDMLKNLNVIGLNRLGPFSDKQIGVIKSILNEHEEKFKDIEGAKIFNIKVTDDNKVKLVTKADKRNTSKIPEIFNNDYAISNWDKLCEDTRLTIPEGFKKIDINELCIDEIVIPDTLQSLRMVDLSNCNTLSKILTHESNEMFTSIDGVLYSKDKKLIVYSPYAREMETYIVNKNTKIIGDQAFMHTNYKNILIPNGVEEIHSMAFAYAEHYEGLTVVIPGSIKTIADDAFEGANIKAIKIARYGSYADDWCKQNDDLRDKITYENAPGKYVLGTDEELCTSVIHGNAWSNVRVLDLGRTGTLVFDGWSLEANIEDFEAPYGRPDYVVRDGVLHYIDYKGAQTKDFIYYPPAKKKSSLEIKGNECLAEMSLTGQQYIEKLEINGYAPDYSASSMKSLQKIIISEGTCEFSENAFDFNWNLKYVYIYETNINLNIDIDNMFEGCDKLEAIFVIRNSRTEKMFKMSQFEDKIHYIGEHYAKNATTIEDILSEYMKNDRIQEKYYEVAHPENRHSPLVVGQFAVNTGNNSVLVVHRTMIMPEQWYADKSKKYLSELRERAYEEGDKGSTEFIEKLKDKFLNVVGTVPGAYKDEFDLWYCNDTNEVIGEYKAIIRVGNTSARDLQKMINSRVNEGQTSEIRFRLF